MSKRPEGYIADKASDGEKWVTEKMPDRRRERGSISSGLLKVMLGGVLLYSLDALTGSGSPADTVRISCKGRDISKEIYHLNRLLAESENCPKLELVEAESSADVSIEFKKGISYSELYARAFALTGNIEANYDIPNKELPLMIMHEILHCAGEAHVKDQHSIMFDTNQIFGELRPSHMQSLRALPDKGYVGRLAACLKLLYGKL